MTFACLFAAALLAVSAVGDAGLVRVFREDRWRAGQHWAAQSLAIKAIAALLLLLAAWEGR